MSQSTPLNTMPEAALPEPVRDALSAPFGTLPALVALQARLRGDHPALCLDGTVWDYATLSRAIDRVAAALQREGLRPGDAVVICAATSLAYVATCLGAVRAGVVVAPLPASSTDDQRAALAANAQARLIFCDATTAPPPPGLRAVWFDGAVPQGQAGQGWNTWLGDDAAASEVVEPPLGAGDPFNIIYSSGTTGMPKGIVQSAGMRWAQLQRSPANGFGADAVTLLAIPLYSNLTLTYLFGTLGVGGTVLLMSKFDAGAWLALAASRGATHAVMVPVQFRRLFDHPDFERTDLGRLRHKFCAGAPFAAELKAEVLRRWPGRLTEYYGLTEGGGRTELQAEAHPDKLHTVGRPSAGNEFRLIDEDGRELAPHEAGEIVGRSATMMSGYHGLPEQTRAVEWFDAQGRRFLRTGDVGRFDADGFLVLLDRRKDMVISGGFNLYPSDLEAVLHGHPAVADAAVVGVPSARWGETPVAFVVRRADPSAPIEAELRAWANERLGKSQRLAELQYVDQLPRSEVGKVLKRALRDAFTRTVP